MHMYGLQSYLDTCCSPNKVYKVLQHLQPNQKGVLQEMGFGGILGLRCTKLDCSLCHWLVENFDTFSRLWSVCSLVKLINIGNIKFFNRCKNFHWYRCIPKNDNETDFFRDPSCPRTKFKTGLNIILSYLTPFNINKWHKIEIEVILLRLISLPPLGFI